DRLRPRVPGRREGADPLRPLPRRRGVHVRHRGRGDADPVDRRSRARGRRGHARAAEGVPGHRARCDRALAALARRGAAARATGVSDTATARINLSAPWIDERDEELVLEVLRSGWLSLGPTGPRFERLMAEAVGAPYCAAVSSGTAGLHLCMRLARLGPGHEAVTSPA